MQDCSYILGIFALASSFTIHPCLLYFLGSQTKNSLKSVQYNKDVNVELSTALGQVLTKMLQQLNSNKMFKILCKNSYYKVQFLLLFSWLFSKLVDHVWKEVVMHDELFSIKWSIFLSYHIMFKNIDDLKYAFMRGTVPYENVKLTLILWTNNFNRSRIPFSIC